MAGDTKQYVGAVVVSPVFFWQKNGGRQIYSVNNAVHVTDKATYEMSRTAAERPVITLGELKEYINTQPVRCANYSLKKLLERSVESVISVMISEFEGICLHMDGDVVYESDEPGKIEEMCVHHLGGLPDTRHLVIRLDGQEQPVYQMSCFYDDVGICMVENDTEADSLLTIMVFADGIVYYRNGRRETIFSMNRCREYRYESVDESLQPECVDVDTIEWYLSLIMFGEERILSNMERHSKTVPLYYENETGRDICDCDTLIWKRSVEEYQRSESLTDMLGEIMEDLREKDRRIFELYYVHREREAAIAEMLGISRKTVSRRLIAVRELLKKKCGVLK